MTDTTAAEYEPPQPEAPDNFPACLAFTLAQEGGYTNDAGDPGGPTNFGITQATLAQWRGVAVAPSDVLLLSQIEAAAIYRRMYWNACRCSTLPLGSDLMVFDFAVNAGAVTSIKELQGQVEVVEDGIFGPATEAAVQACGTVALVMALQEAHEAHYRSLPDFTTFGNGWLARLSRCATQALAMAGVTT